MKKLLATLAFLAAVPLAAVAQVTKEDIKKLVAAGVSDDVVLTYVRANGPAPKMSADDIVELKQAGAGEKVLAALASGTNTPSTPAPEPVPAQVVERPVYVPQTTYVYSQPGVSSYWCSSHYCYDSCSTYVRPIVTYSTPYYYSYPYWSRPYYGYAPRYYSSWYRPSFGVGVGYGWGYRSCGRSRVGISVGWGW